MSLSIANYKKFIVRVGILLIVVIAGLAFWTNQMLENVAQVELDHAIQIEVQPGDTIWSIAKSHMSDLDPRVAAENIILINNLSGEGTIHPGQTLTIPIESENSDFLRASN